MRSDYGARSKDSRALATRSDPLFEKAVGLLRRITWLSRMRQYSRYALVWPPVGCARLGDLRCIEPTRSQSSDIRGTPVDQWYAERFLAANATDIRGEVLEIGPVRRCHGQADHFRVRCRVEEWRDDLEDKIAVCINSAAPIHDAFDCIVCTDVLRSVPDIREAIRTAYRMVKPNGVLLVTMPGIGQVREVPGDSVRDYWRVTSMCASRLFGEVARPEDIVVRASGNVLAAASLLQGLPAEEMRPSDLEFTDRDYEVLVTVRVLKRAMKGGAPSA